MSSQQTTAQIAKTFGDNVESVYRLMNFDRLVLDLCIRQVRTLVERLEKVGYMKNHPTIGAGNTLTVLENIRTNDSLRNQYGEMFNQSLVLLVSYFGLSIRDLFKESLTLALRAGRLDKLAQQEIKITLGNLQPTDVDIVEKLAEMFVLQRDISFQDMQSIARAFGEFLGCPSDKDKAVNNIILGQACRHVIVHSGGGIDDKLLRQVSHATPRDLKLKLVAGNKLQFEPDEIHVIGESMKQHFSNLLRLLDKKFSP